MRVVYMTLTGGLGNQLFQYYSALAYAQKHTRVLLIGTEVLRRNWQRNYELAMFVSESSDVVITNTVRTDNVNVITESTFNKAEYDHCEEVVLKGYFQSEKYISPIENKIRRRYEDIASKVMVTSREDCGLHIRGGDYRLSRLTNAKYGTIATIDY